MKNLVKKVQKHLENEFSKRGVVFSQQLFEESISLAFTYDKLRTEPETLEISEIKQMMQWLEINEIVIENVKIFKIN